EFLSPLPEVKCENNPALRDDPTTPVAADEVTRLPINQQSKTFDRTAFNLKKLVTVMATLRAEHGKTVAVET
ncbi:MAG: hypothetical protein ACKO2P_17655, partial [Planctomycetota bacterium]